MGNENKTLEEAIKHVVNYYAFFEYAPSFEELHKYLPTLTTKEKLTNILSKLVQEGILMQKHGKYTLRGHSIFIKNYIRKKRTSEHKIRSISLYLRVVSVLVPIQLIGLSGSIAMLDADPDDDIDLFIITKAGRMWTSRLICLFVATILGLRRKRDQKNAANKVCLNLFYDERELSVPINKRNEYTAHEVLQMKPVIDKNGLYKKFINANGWVNDYFPNNPSVILANAGIYKSKNNFYRFPIRSGMTKNDSKRTFSSPFENIIEVIVKKIQLHIIARHQTTEIITPTQLWFFPQDFEKKLRSKGIL